MLLTMGWMNGIWCQVQARFFSSLSHPEGLCLGNSQSTDTWPWIMRLSCEVGEWVPSTDICNWWSCTPSTPKLLHGMVLRHISNLPDLFYVITNPHFYEMHLLFTCMSLVQIQAWRTCFKLRRLFRTTRLFLQTRRWRNQFAWILFYFIYQNITVDNLLYIHIQKTCLSSNLKIWKADWWRDMFRKF
jgi:hypothetical protein